MIIIGTVIVNHDSLSFIIKIITSQFNQPTCCLSSLCHHLDCGDKLLREHAVFSRGNLDSDDQWSLTMKKVTIMMTMLTIIIMTLKVMMDDNDVGDDHVLKKLQFSLKQNFANHFVTL